MEKIYKKKSLLLAVVLSLGLVGTISPQQRAGDGFDDAFKSALNILCMLAGGYFIVEGGLDVNNAMCDAYGTGRSGSTVLPLKAQPTLGVIKCAVGLAFAALNGDYLLRRITKPKAMEIETIVEQKLKDAMKKCRQDKASQTSESR